jgi:glycosyltransferase involved in cell wall biosynthesis
VSRELRIVDFPEVSVIISTYNRPDRLREALESVCSQTFQFWECVVVNDGGQDVRTIIEGLRDKRIRYVNKEHGGYPAAANLGLSIAKGKYVSYLGDDDKWYPNHLEICIALLERDRDVGVVYTKQVRRSFRWDGERRVIVEDYLEPITEFNWSRLLEGNWIPITSVVHKRELLEQSGPFKDLPVLEDWELLLRFGSFTKFAHIPIITGEYYHDLGGESRNERLKRERPKQYRKIVRDIRKPYVSCNVHEELAEYFPERFVLHSLFAGSGLAGFLLKGTSYLYLYSRRCGRRASFREFCNWTLKSFHH